MQTIHTPRLTPPYWAILSAASVFGANLGDFVSHDLHGGHWRGLGPMAIVLAAIFAMERRSSRPGALFYWLAIITVRAAATNLADLATHDGRIPYGYVIAALALALALITAASRAPGHPPGLPRTNGWYWAGMLLAGTLGTAIGDGTADKLGLGVGAGSAVLVGVTAILLALRAWPAAAITAGYWVTVVAIRAAGTTLGDLLAHTISLDLGTLLSGLVFVSAAAVGQQRRAPASADAD